MTDNQNQLPEEPEQPVVPDNAESKIIASDPSQPIAQPEPQTSNSKPQTDSMEVHHHGHVHEKKKWKEYVFQFFMLFLAVFCGFLAEYQLEQTIERHREKDYIISYISNLKKDTAGLSDFKQKNKIRILFLDSLLAMKKTDLSLPENCRKFYYYYLRTKFYPNYTPRDATVVQLKSSGSLRLIRSTQVTDSILKYDFLNKYMSDRGDFLYAKILRTWEAANLVMDISIQSDTSYYVYAKRMLIKQPPPLINDPEKQRTFFNCVSEEIRINETYLQYLTGTRTTAEVHLRFIKKEYKLNDE